MKKDYSELLRDPRWQKKRLEILNRDDFMCQDCRSRTETLHVHHRYYISGRLPWEYPPFCYQTLCENCHDLVKEVQSGRREQGLGLLEPWELGLDYFGESIFDMWAAESIAAQ